jgi:hypothetical protein
MLGGVEGVEPSVHTAKSAAVCVAILTLIAAGASPDHLLVLCDGGALAVALWMLWPATDAPILLLPFGLQWISVAIKPMQTALTGQPLDTLGEFGQPLTDAAWFGLAGVTALGLGMWLFARRAHVDWAATLARDAANWTEGLVVQISLALIVVGTLLQAVAFHTGSATQIFLAFGEAQNAGIFVLAYWCLRESKALWVLAAVVAFEVVYGMTGYFAGFRETFLVLVIAAAAARPRLGVRGLLGVGAVFSAMLVVAVFWTSIKADYRGYLNQGSQQQVVMRTMSDRLSYVGKAADEFDQDQFRTGLRKLTSRLSYIDFLALTMNYVPGVIPHEDGRRLSEALTNIFEPRILFPDKPPTPDDSVITSRYTGIRLDTSGGTSISIGYLGELYIDFGKPPAVFGAFLIGCFAGFAYRVIRSFRGIPLFFSYGIATMALLVFGVFETDLVRFLGSAITYFLAAFVLQRAVAPQVLMALTNREARMRPA